MLSTTFAMPEGYRDWKAVLTFPDGRSDTKSGFLIPVEDDRWMAAVGERHAAPPSPDEESFRELVRQLRTPTIHDAISSAQRLGAINRFAFPASSWRHYERLPGFPPGLLPIGDAILPLQSGLCPWGMTVAAQEACILRELLRARSTDRQPLTGLGPAFIAAAQPVIGTAWSMSPVADFARPLTRGERPANVEQSLHSAMALNRLAVRDPQVHKLLIAVRQMIEPPSAPKAPEFMRQVELEMAA
jgi:hypothetical protein